MFELGAFALTGLRATPKGISPNAKQEILSSPELTRHHFSTTWLSKDFFQFLPIWEVIITKDTITQ